MSAQKVLYTSFIVCLKRLSENVDGKVTLMERSVPTLYEYSCNLLGNSNNVFWKCQWNTSCLLRESTAVVLRQMVQTLCVAWERRRRDTYRRVARVWTINTTCYSLHRSKIRYLIYVLFVVITVHGFMWTSVLIND